MLLNLCLPGIRKERCLPSLVANTPRLAARTGLTRRRTKAIMTRASTLLGLDPTIDEPEKEFITVQDCAEKSIKNKRQPVTITLDEEEEEASQYQSVEEAPEEAITLTPPTTQIEVVTLVTTALISAISPSTTLVFDDRGQSMVESPKKTDESIVLISGALATITTSAIIVATTALTPASVLTNLRASTTPADPCLSLSSSTTSDNEELDLIAKADGTVAIDIERFTRRLIQRTVNRAALLLSPAMRESGRQWVLSTMGSILRCSLFPSLDTLVESVNKFSMMLA